MSANSKHLAIIVLCFTTMSGVAQIKVNQSGNVKIGAETFWNEGRLQIMDNNKTTEARIFATSPNISRLWTMNQIYSFGLGVDANGIGHIYRNVNSPGYIMTFNSSGNVSIGTSTIYSQYKLYVLGDFRVWGQVSCRDGYWVNSDLRLKTNVLPIENALDKITNLNGKTYSLKKTNRKACENDVKYGLIAQEVKEIVPELVKETEDSSSFLSINYDGLIPILIEAIKEQQVTIDSISRKIKELEKAVNSNTRIKKKAVPSSNSDKEEMNETIKEEDITTNAFLLQNTPNPFSTQTEIRYCVPENTKNANIYVFSLNGNLLLTKPITQLGNGGVTIYNNELNAGMYIYTLTIDGVEVDSKRMILTDK